MYNITSKRLGTTLPASKGITGAGGNSIYTHIIVGGGTAGCVMASRLTEDPDVRLLLLEAGPHDTSRNIHFPALYYKLTGGPLTWGYHTAPSAQRDGYEMPFAQARVLGGGSSINGMVFTRGHASDYDRWASECGCVGWSFAEVQPYFQRSENNTRLTNSFHGHDGPIGVSDLISPLPISKAFVDAAQQAGLPFNDDFNGADQTGCGLYQVTQRRARRSSAAVEYLRPALNRGTLEVKTSATVLRVLVDAGRATGVEYLHNGSSTKATADNCVIISAGAIGSPALLLRSGIGPASELEAVGVQPIHDLPGVGKNLQDHIDVYSIHALNGAYTYDKHTRWHKQLLAALQYLAFRTGPVTSNLAEAGGFWRIDPSTSIDNPPDIQFHFLPGAGIEAGVPPVPGGYGCTINSCFLHPRSRGSVRLRSARVDDAPIIDPNYWSEQYDLDMSLQGFEMTREIASQPALSRLIKHEHLPGAAVKTRKDLIAYAKRFGKTDYHPVGTCKMGVDDASVVDPQCRLHGIEGLRVADSSIMPQLISSNTNAATVMLAEKASDLIQGVK